MPTSSTEVPVPKPPPRRSPIAVDLPAHGVYAWESRHDFGFRMAPEKHAFLEVFYVLSGVGAFVVDGDRHAVSPGDVVVVPPRTMHHIEDSTQSPMTLYGICIASHLVGCDAGVPPRLRPGRMAVGPALGVQVRTELRRLLFEQTVDQPGSRLQVLGLAMQLLADLVRSPSQPPDESADSEATRFRAAVARYIAELPFRFYEATTLDRVAAELGMSRRCFTRLFRAAAGGTWLQRVEEARIAYACRLLRETPRGITTIAFECGYEELSSFYRAFKRQTGLPPRAWREEHAGAGNGGPKRKTV